MTALATPSLWFLDNRVEILSESDDHALLELSAHSGDTVPLHVHHDEDEVFTVLEGELTLLVDGAQTVVGAGRSVTAPRGLPHAYCVTSAGPSRWLVLTTPGAFARLVRELSRPAGDGLPAPSGPPSPEQAGILIEVAARHGIEILAQPPFPH